MCGLAGFVAPVSSFQANAILESMATSLAHRGPDSYGTWTKNIGGQQTLGLAHTLLSIIGKPNEGKQPFHIPGSALVFNGTLYNHHELRRQLQSRGYEFKTQTDTEVLAVGFSADGPKFLKRLRGMWAFAFWNDQKKTLQLCRDPFGVKPLYYCSRPGLFCFSSEYKAILKHLPEATIDTTAVYDYLRLRYVPGRATLIQEIRKVPPGCLLEFNPALGSLTELPYFELSPVPTTQEESFHLLNQAISRRAVADVKVGALLSSGIDSAVVCDILQREVKSLHTYTLKVSDELKDESSKAKQIANKIGAQNTTIFPGTPTLDNLSRLAFHLDDPYGDPIILALDQIFSSISGKHRVVVTGEGSDEIFSGYVHHRAMYAFEKFASPLLSKCLEKIPRSFIRAVLPYTAQLSATDYDEALSRFRRLRTDTSLLAFQSIFHTFCDNDFVEPQNSDLRTHANERASLDSLRKWDLRYWLTDSQLFKMDKIAMASSIEAREPFVDIDLISAISSIPSDQHLSLTSDKPILRKMIASHVRIGEAIVHSRKTSFYQPLNPQALGSLPQAILEHVRSNKSFLKTFINESALSQTLSNVTANVLQQKRLFSLVMLLFWRDRIWSLKSNGPLFEPYQ